MVGVAREGAASKTDPLPALVHPAGANLPMDQVYRNVLHEVRTAAALAAPAGPDVSAPPAPPGAPAVPAPQAHGATLMAGSELLSTYMPNFLAICFPTLLPRGLGDFGAPRATVISFADYVRRLMTIRSPRFRQHPMFQFVCFDRILKA